MLYDLTVVQFSKMLNNLSAFLQAGEDHAKAKGFQVSVLMQSRLAPDQYPLWRQVQIACDTAKLGVARLTDRVDSAPKHADGESTYEECQARIKDVIAYLATYQSADFKTAETQRITRERWEGKYLTGRAFAIEHATPNLYFHVTTAYAILRHNGVVLGKKDFLGPLPYTD